MMIKKSREQGQVLILIAIGIVGLIGMVALAVDGGNAFMDRRNAQNAADAAAMSAGFAVVSKRDPNGAALSIAATNNYTNDGTRSTVTVQYPPAAGCKGEIGPYAGNEEYLQVIIHSYLDTFFAQVVGITRIHNCVEAIVYIKPPYTEAMFNGNALVALNPEDCMAFDAGGTSGTVVTGGGVFVNSNSSCGQGAFRQHGAGILTNEGVCVVGSYSYDPGKVTPPPAGGCQDEDYPPEIIYPDPVCEANASRSGTTWTAGNISGNDFKGTMELGPGIYCISGNVTINAGDEISGIGVLLYVMNGSFYVNGHAFVELEGLESGKYAGLLMYLPLSNTNPVELNGNSDSGYWGTIFAPASLIRINGTGSATGYKSQIIGYNIELVGNAATSIHYEDSMNYDATVPDSIELAK